MIQAGSKFRMQTIVQVLICLVDTYTTSSEYERQLHATSDIH